MKYRLTYFNNLKIIYASAKQKTQLLILLQYALAVLTAVAEILLIANVIPSLKKLESGLFLTQSTLVLLLLIIVTPILKIIYLRTESLTSAYVANDINTLTYKSFFRKEFLELSTINSNNLKEILITKTDRTAKCISSTLNALTDVTVVVLIIGSILFQKPIESIFVFGTAFAYYISFTVFTKKALNSNSKTFSTLSAINVQNIVNSIYSAKEIYLSKKFKFLQQSKFANTNLSLKLKASNSMFLLGLPKIGLEAIGLFSIVMASLAANLINGGESILNNIIFLGIGSQRLLPYLNSLIRSWGIYQSRKHDFMYVADLIMSPKTKGRKLNSSEVFQDIKSFKAINISFSYNSKSPPLLQNINFTLDKGDLLLVNGDSGSGKSTLINIICGLIQPLKGGIFVNDLKLPIHNNKELNNMWKDRISYVPQNSIILNSTLIENIALKDQDDVNITEVIASCEMARIWDILKEKHIGPNNMLSSNSSGLSGGQLQRIGLARCFYKKADVIILDEATNALDQKLEESLLQNLISLKKIIIMISHNPMHRRYATKTISLKK